MPISLYLTAHQPAKRARLLDLASLHTGLPLAYLAVANTIICQAKHLWQRLLKRKINKKIFGCLLETIYLLFSNVLTFNVTMRVIVRKNVNSLSPHFFGKILNNHRFIKDSS